MILVNNVYETYLYMYFSSNLQFQVFGVVYLKHNEISNDLTSSDKNQVSYLFDEKSVSIYVNTLY